MKTVNIIRTTLFCPLKHTARLNSLESFNYMNAKIRSIILLANLLKGFVQICNLISINCK